MPRKSSIAEKIECPNCGKMTIQKAGVFEKRQRYHCTSCGKYFFVGFSARRNSALQRKLAILMHVAGAPIKDIAQCVGRAPNTVSTWLDATDEMLVKEPEINELRSSTRKGGKTTRNFPAAFWLKKRWLMIELDDADNKLPSIIITRTPDES